MGVPSMQLLAAKAAGGSSFVPTDIAGCAAWWDADDASTFTYSSGSIIATWADKSGNSRTLTQVNASPTIARNTTINGVDAVDFPGLGQRMTSGSVYTISTATVFIVASPDSLVGSRNIVATAASPGTATAYTTGTSLGLFAGSVVTGGTLSTATPYVLQWTLDGASSAGRASGGSSLLSGNPGAGVYTGIGVAGYRAGASDNFDGKIGEIIVYDSALSLADINDVGNYLAAKWGITWSTAT